MLEIQGQKRKQEHFSQANLLVLMLLTVVILGVKYVKSGLMIKEKLGILRKKEKYAWKTNEFLLSFLF